VNIGGQVDTLLGTVPGKVLKKFLDDQAPNWAVLIAWNALFAMFPIIIFVASVLGAALNIIGITSTKVTGTLVSAIPDPQIRMQLDKSLAGVQHNAGLLFIIGLLGMLWGGSALFGAMEQAFAVIYHTKPRDFLWQKLLSFAMVFAFMALIAVSIGSAGILPALQTLPFVGQFLKHGPAADILQVIIGIASGFVLFSLLYFVIPNRKQHYFKIWPGALVAGIIFEIITLLFPLYLAINKGTAAYGTFGLFLILLTFFFFFGLITMIGVEVNSVLYPVPVEQPAREPIASAPKTASEAERRRATPQVSGPHAQARETSNGATRKGLHARTAFGLAVVASVIGVLVGRRTASPD
jgi:membrane protein